jgi:hypothetical protein
VPRRLPLPLSLSLSLSLTGEEGVRAHFTGQREREGGRERKRERKREGERVRKQKVHACSKRSSFSQSECVIIILMGEGGFINQVKRTFEGDLVCLRPPSFRNDHKIIVRGVVNATP